MTTNVALSLDGTATPHDAGFAGRCGVRHLAIIMDGNGRWAKERGQGRMFGHNAGVEALRRTVEAAGDLGLEVLTVYAFSTENWRRPPAEVDWLFALLRSYVKSDLDRLDRAGVRIRVLGRQDGLPDDILELITMAETRTRLNTAMSLVIAFNYGGQAEIVDAVKALATDVKNGRLVLEDIDQTSISKRLGTAEWPDPDAIVRTSGEQRLSNFMLWQAAYAEFIVTDGYWPDFGRAELISALETFAGRQRRFGGV
jgi:undecaprenyl diphosphate synthase